MATAEKKEEQQHPVIQPDEYSDADYNTDDYSLSEDEQDQKPQRPNQQQSRRRKQQQRRRQDDDFDDESDYLSDEYDSEEYDDFDDAHQGNAVQPYQRGTQSLTQNTISNGAMTDAAGQGKSEEEQDGLKLKLELNLDIEVELKAHIHGDLTLSLL
ncbi:hypothetical protein BDV28DRAFT_133737 [Aspergillus coremiiformis]|uniref:Uncharacterized protein n=1 Tax=Aspergillus coremiiformis TaxID=138285 RepID=A0A5N6Z656_9EURO|nr:hypothetical protein BDV28DRAFT_133737 [Aspergillus coremiiformis]